MTYLPRSQIQPIIDVCDFRIYPRYDQLLFLSSQRIKSSMIDWYFQLVVFAIYVVM